MSEQQNKAEDSVTVQIDDVRLSACWLLEPRRNKFKPDVLEYTAMAAFDKKDEREKAEFMKVHGAMMGLVRQVWPDVDDHLMYSTPEGEQRKVRTPFMDGDMQQAPRNARSDWKPWDRALGRWMLRAKSKQSAGGLRDPGLYWWAPDEEGKPILLDRRKHAKAIREHFFGDCRVARLQVRFAAWELENRFVACYIRWAQAAKEPGAAPGVVRADDLRLEKGAPPAVDGPGDAPAGGPPQPPRGRYAEGPRASGVGEDPGPAPEDFDEDDDGIPF